MRLLRKHKATLKRSSEGFWGIDGSYQASLPDETIIRGSVQPKFRGSEFQKSLPEGIHDKDCKTMYTETELFVGSEKEQRVSDTIVFMNKEYEVYEVEEWFSGTNRLSHYKVIMIRKDKLNGVN